MVAREYGFPSWRDLVFYVEKVIQEYEHRPSGALGDLRYTLPRRNTA